MNYFLVFQGVPPETVTQALVVLMSTPGALREAASNAGAPREAAEPQAAG